MKDVIPIVAMATLFVLMDGLALLVVSPFQAEGLTAFENPSNPLNLVFFFLALVGFTAVMLLISKFWKKQLIQAIVLGSTGYLAFYVFFPLLALAIPYLVALVVSIAAAALMLVLLVKYPEWYVVDVSGVVIGLGAIALLGISLTVSLVIILLIGLAVYDAISVYQTKHMIDLADTVLDLKLPVILVIPKARKFSLIKQTKGLKEKLETGEERDAFFMGLGDVVMPGILVTSTFSSIPHNGLLVALSVILGTLLGFSVLTVFLLKGKPQAGLPYLCSGAILGYIVSSYLLFGQPAGLAFLI